MHNINFDVETGINIPEDIIRNNYNICLKNKQIGEFTLSKSFITKHINFEGFVIHDEYRKQGYGKLFLQKLIEILCKDNFYTGITLHCLKSNKVAKHLYKSIGFKRKIVKNYYNMLWVLKFNNG